MNRKKIIKAMTIEEKASLFTGSSFWHSTPIKRLDIPRITFADGPHGLRTQNEKSDHLGLHKGEKATCFPTSASLANSWDVGLLYEVGNAIGIEAVAQKVDVVLGPGVNIKRNPLCGRNFEYFSEDPYLTGKLATQYVKGLQTNNISACPKHFAVNNQEHLRMHNDSIVDQRALHEIYLTAFEMIVKEAKPNALMTSYNKINGVHASENKELLDKLKKDWEFNGLVISDWGGSNDTIKGIEAGSHIEMPSTGENTKENILRAITEGTITEQLLDQRVDEYLEAISLIANTHEPKSNFFDKHHKLAEKAASNSIVLLKNQDSILPIKGQKIAFIGDLGITPRYQGNGSSLVSPTQLDYLHEIVSDYNLNISGTTTGYKRGGKTKKSDILQALELAKTSDIIVMYLGLEEAEESEGIDRRSINISDHQLNLLKEISEINNNVIAVVCGGAVIDMSWEKKVKAIIHGYLPGQAGSKAILNILTGITNPSGKLSETYPSSYDDVPSASIYPGTEQTSEYLESIFVGYRYYDTKKIEVKYPFGYGLSYTTFEYSNLSINDHEVSFTLTNTGTVHGAEVPQLYIGMQDSKVLRPKKELKGFTKVHLVPNQSKEITIPFDQYSFRYFDPEKNQYENEPGHYLISIGSSSSDIRLKGQYILHTSPTNTSKIWSSDTLSINQVPFSREDYTKIYHQELPSPYWDRSKKITANDTIAQLEYSKSILARIVLFFLKKSYLSSIKKKKSNLNLYFIYNMSFRSIEKMTVGKVNATMIDGLLLIVNGKFFKGSNKLIRELMSKRKSRKRCNKNDRCN